MSEENPLKVRKMESTHIIDMSPGASNKFMMRAIELAKKAGIEERSGGCFGAVVVKNGEIVGEGYNQVFTTFDPTCHAEMAAIRDASARLKSFELKDCDVFTSNEPCPMCLSACYWARIRKVFYASTVADARDYGNFDDDIFYEELHKEPAERVLKVEPDHESRSSMVEVWKEFQLVNTGPNGIHY